MRYNENSEDCRKRGGLEHVEKMDAFLSRACTLCILGICRTRRSGGQGEARARGTRDGARQERLDVGAGVGYDRRLQFDDREGEEARCEGQCHDSSLQRQDRYDLQPRRHPSHQAADG